MRVFLSSLFFIAVMFLFRGMAAAQIPVEVFAGHKKTSLDILFFKYFKTKSGVNTPLLLFNRNRAVVDYQMTTTTFLPQFGFTEAISLNYKQLKGFAPVVVAQIFSTGVFAKAGFQYAYIKKDLTLFSWLVCETKKEPGIDLFFLGRYTPKLVGSWHAFSQLEMLGSAPTAVQANFSFTQRARMGLKRNPFQFGAGVDIQQTGRKNFTILTNFGAFLRYEI